MAIPRPCTQMRETQPGLRNACESLGEECAKAGPLDAKTIALIKLATSPAAGLEGAAHSHTREALEAGCTPDRIEHVALLGTPTLGFPTMMRNRAWVHDVTGRD